MIESLISVDLQYAIVQPNGSHGNAFKNGNRTERAKKAEDLWKFVTRVRSKEKENNIELARDKYVSDTGPGGPYHYVSSDYTLPTNGTHHFKFYRISEEGLRHFPVLPPRRKGDLLLAWVAPGVAGSEAHIQSGKFTLIERSAESDTYFVSVESNLHSTYAKHFKGTANVTSKPRVAWWKADLSENAWKLVKREDKIQHGRFYIFLYPPRGDTASGAGGGSVAGHSRTATALLQQHVTVSATSPFKPLPVALVRQP